MFWHIYSIVARMANLANMLLSLKQNVMNLGWVLNFHYMYCSCQNNLPIGAAVEVNMIS